MKKPYPHLQALKQNNKISTEMNVMVTARKWGEGLIKTFPSTKNSMRYFIKIHLMISNLTRYNTILEGFLKLHTDGKYRVT